MNESVAQDERNLGRPAALTVEHAARTVIDAGLRRHDSAFTPGHPVWTLAYVAELKRLFVEQPDVTGLNFDEKLAVQLGGAADGARQLFAELYYLNLLPLEDYTGAKKRALIDGVLAAMVQPVSVPGELRDVLDGGVFNGGVAFKTRRYWQLCLLIEFAETFLNQPESEQRRALEEPLAFREVIRSVTAPNEPAQRQSLLYLAHPDFYLPIVSNDHRRWIHNAFVARIDKRTNDLDVDLNAIIKVLGNVGLYQSPWREMWDPKASQPATHPIPHASTAIAETSDQEEVVLDATPELANALHIDQEFLQEWIELLRDRPQLIFFGPPGTGKTYIAQELATHIAGDNVRLVQFHPSTSYEDFFEGYRPETGDDGSVGFRLKDGPLRKIAREAAADEADRIPHVLIIDEINRGNLARIFGELYFLLEYRRHSVELLYAQSSDAGFRLPTNLIIIGTMNTADRSIALVDAAMRRRFAFVGLHPSEPPVKTVLRRWLRAREHDELAADMLDRLNSVIDDRDFRIGPSYFMRPAVHRPGGLERVWRTSIVPLLEEHHYGQAIDVPSRYGYQTILEAVRPPAAPAHTATAEPDDAASPHAD